MIVQNARELIHQGREIFRFDTFGDEAFWGDTLRLHEAIATVSPNAALSLGLKVDVEALLHTLEDTRQALLGEWMSHEALPRG